MFSLPHTIGRHGVQQGQLLESLKSTNAGRGFSHETPLKNHKRPTRDQLLTHSKTLLPHAAKHVLTSTYHSASRHTRETVARVPRTNKCWAWFLSLNNVEKPQSSNTRPAPDSPSGTFATRCDACSHFHLPSGVAAYRRDSCSSPSDQQTRGVVSLTKHR